MDNLNINNFNNTGNQNARMDLSGYKSKPYELFESLNVTNDKFDRITGNFQHSDLSVLYFTQENIDYLQTQIIKRIYEKTSKKHLVGKQSEDELIIVMRSIYFQHSKNMRDRLDQQINILNELVLEYCVDNVLTNLQQYVKYIHDITTDQPLMDKPVSTNIKGDKTLELRPFFN